MTNIEQVWTFVGKVGELFTILAEIEALANGHGLRVVPA